ncbi:MAG: hypothetical protein NTV80_11800 [Verrucomicrobia bacterium]|nr:hypothetical protein [Verrucomicrobiota bacterium]
MSDNEVTSDTPAPKPSVAVDLSDLKMMPGWVSGIGSAPANLSRFEEREDRGPRRDGDRRGGPPGRGAGGGQSRDRGDSRPPRRDGPPGQGGGPRRDGPPGQGGGPRRDGPPGQGGGPRRDGGDRNGPRRFSDRDGPRQPQRDWVEIPRDVQVTIEPEDKSAEALANHIRNSGHAFSMFDAARLVLAEGDRFQARYTCASERQSGLFVTPADGGLFLTRDEATQHVLRGAALESYYRTEEIELEEPKGDFKSVGVCGMSGELIAPPSHHSFQTAIIRLHRERFSNMPLEDYKRRVRVESDPELVTKWKEQQKKGMRWIWLKDEPAEGAEPTTLSTRAEMESHFRRIHGEDAVREVREAIVHGNVDKQKLSHVLFILLRGAVDTARKHLFEMSQKLGGGFERRSLKLFKRRAGKLFVCRVKPKAIDPGVVFSTRVSNLVEVLKGKSGIMLHDLVEAICPSAPAAEPVEGEATAPKVTAPPTEEQISVIKDIRWLANEGYVIEYSDGMVFLGVQGEVQAPKAPKAAPKAEAATEAAPAEVSDAATEEADALTTAEEVEAPESVEEATAVESEALLVEEVTEPEVESEITEVKEDPVP